MSCREPLGDVTTSRGNGDELRIFDSAEVVGETVGDPTTAEDAPSNSSLGQVAHGIGSMSPKVVVIS